MEMIKVLAPKRQLYPTFELLAVSCERGRRIKLDFRNLKIHEEFYNPMGERRP
jgi:hypothetical protein